MGSTRFLVMGCGGIGGIATAVLSEAGQDVCAVTTNRAILDAVSSRGLRLRGEGDARAVKARVVYGVPDEKFDVVLLATQPPQVEQAARMALPALAKDGLMVCLQNGLCEERVAPIAGRERTFGAVVAWGAAMPEPGVYDRTASGGFALGRVDGADDPRLAPLATVLEAIGPVEVTRNLAGKRWSKLAINCAISSLGTIGGDRLGPLIQHRFVRRLGLEIMSEAVHVARTEGVALEKVSGTIDLEWMALTDDEKVASGSGGLFAKHAVLLAVGYRYRRMRSSMLSAIERGRTPAVEFLNGEITSRGARSGVATPMNDRVREAVWQIARKELASSLETLRALFDDTRAVARAA